MKNTIKLLIFGILYSVSFLILYLYYLVPVWGIDGYDIYRANPYLLICFVYTILPIIFAKELNLSSFISFFIYFLMYVPVIYTLYFNSKIISYVELFIIHTLLMLFMILFFWISNLNLKKFHIKIGFDKDFIFTIFFVFILIIYIYKYKSFFSLKNFNEIYLLRKENVEMLRGISRYIPMWSVGIIIPYFFSLNLYKRDLKIRLVYLGISIIYAFVMYAFLGMKSVIFIFPFMFGIYFVLKYFKKSFFHFILLVLSLIVLSLILLPDVGILYWIKSIILQRTLAVSGWTMSKYYDYFTEVGYSYYTHVDILNKFLGIDVYYPFGSLGFGQLIALEIGATTDASFNANFWATDGIAAFGIPGLIIINIISLFLLIIFNLLSSKNELIIKQQIIMCTGFLMNLTNVGLFESLLNGGGFFIIIYLLFNSERVSYENRAS